MKRINVMQRVSSIAGLAAAIALAGAATASAQSPAAKPVKPAAGTEPAKTAVAAPQGYSVVLVLGDMQNPSPADSNVPAAARKALADLKDFLPYKSYRLLDAQWMLGSQRTVSRLRGANDQDYQLTLRGIPVAPAGKLNVTFRLAEAGALTMIAAPPGENDALAARLATLQNALRESQAAAKTGDAANGERQRAEAAAIAREIVRLEQEASLKDAAMRGTHAIIDTTFTMDVGETVVVGTSRVAGDKALIALLTAVTHAGR